MSKRRKRDSSDLREDPGAASSSAAAMSLPLPPVQTPTAYSAAPSTEDPASMLETTALPPLSPTLDEAIATPNATAQLGIVTPTTQRSTAGAARGRLSSNGATQHMQAIIPLKTGAERDRALAALNSASDTATTLIPGARKYRPPTATVVPRRNAPRSAITQFAVSMIVTAMLISALTLSTPLGQTAALDLNGPLRAYTNTAPWLPTPTPTPKPTPVISFRPPAGANPGQQAVINEIIAVFGPYAQGALGVARCESGFDPNAWNSYPIMNSHASGVFQILYPSTWDGTSYASYSPFDANANIHAAYQIFQRDGYTWREWQCQP